ncbi:MAG: hypothetical protein ACPG8W_17305 [Candidatus Promineifilaceae bacterium]
MDVNTIVRLGLILMFAVGLYFAMKGRGPTAEEKCPKCGTRDVQVLSRETENIEVNTMSLPGVGGRTSVRTRFSFACQKCGHCWQKSIHT